MKNKQVFVIQPFNQNSSRVFSWISAAAKALGFEVLRADQAIGVSEPLGEAINQMIKEADLIVCDLAGRNANVLYELGVAHALRKPVLLLSDNIESVPFDLRSTRILIYDLLAADQQIVSEIKHLLNEGIRKPGPIRGRPVPKPEINNVFVSYSHKDDGYLRRLLVHLRPLQREGQIDLWVDTQIKVGEKWKQAIEKALSKARVAILLISADFIASDFIVDNELPPILAKAESEGTKIIPVILKPCRFSRDRNLSRFQAVNGPDYPLSKLTEHECEEVYDRIAQTVEEFMRAR